MVNATIVPKLFLATIVFHCLDSILTRPFLAICSLFFLFGLQKEPNGSKQRHLRQAMPGCTSAVAKSKKFKLEVNLLTNIILYRYMLEINLKQIY
jgi:hypothetical protein